MGDYEMSATGDYALFSGRHRARVNDEVMRTLFAAYRHLILEDITTKQGFYHFNARKIYWAEGHDTRGSPD